MQFKHIIDVENGIVVLENGFQYQADVSYFKTRDVRLVIYSDDGDYWIEKDPFNGREKEVNIKAKADEQINAAQAAYEAKNEPLTDAEKLASERDSMNVSAFQAKAALMQSGYYDQVVSYMNDPSTDAVTKLAWDEATEFRRRSPTVASLASLLSLSETDIDDLFRLAATIEA